MSAEVNVVGLDHLVLCTPDVERSLAWYCDALGLEPVRVDEWRRGEVLFPSVRIDATTIIDVLESERTGKNVDHLCFVVAPTDFAAIIESGRFDVVGGPSRLFGAQGEGEGIYVRDPDGNVVELRHYG